MPTSDVGRAPANGSRTAMRSCASKVVFQLNWHHANPARQQCQLVIESRHLRDQIVTVFTKEIDARDSCGLQSFAFHL